MIVVLLIVYFGADLRTFVKNANEGKVRVAGFEVTLTRQLQSAAALGAATASRAVGDTNPSVSALESNDLRAIADTVSEAATPKAAKRLSESTVLWVDDRPANIVNERTALEALGIRFVISTSTEDALEKIHLKRYDAVISDMGRPPDPQAGYTLLEQLKRANIEIPFIIYASSNLPEHKALARSKGAIDSTSRPQELFQLVISAVLGRP